MKKPLLAATLWLLFLPCFAQTSPIQTQDTMRGTAQSWRDTCFGLLNKTATWIPSGGFYKNFFCNKSQTHNFTLTFSIFLQTL